FEVWGLHGLNDITLAFSIIMITFEIVAGIAVLIGWQFRLFSWLLLLLIIFFTFLTGYAVLSGKIRECGCFGDCIKLTAMDSFIKDLLLLGLIVFLFIQRDKVKPIFSRNASIALLTVTTVTTLALQWHVLEHLPIVDCLPYKKRANVLENMKPPPGSIPDSVVITFVYQKDGKEVEFTADKFPADFGDSYKFVRRANKIVRKGNATPPIRDFVLKDTSGNDQTQAYLSLPGKKLVLFVRNVPENISAHAAALNMVYGAAKQFNADVTVVTSSPEETREAFDKIFGGKPLNYFVCDVVAVKTASRSPITIYFLDNATIVDKWSYHDADAAASAIRRH
ncbi:MAG TPA: BT_3928 family protein, partial [Chitinophagaceae bacterium]